MKVIIRVFSTLWKVYFILILVGILLILYPFYLILLNNERFFKAGFNLMKFHAGIVLLLVGIYPKVYRQSKELIKGPFVICPNHTSYLDILLLYRIFPDYFIFMGKQELGNVPVFNIFFKKMNILVNRASITGSARALDQAELAINKGHNVVIFPEGTIPPNAPKLKVFKNGPFKLAIKKQIPIVCVTFRNNYRFLQDGAFFKRNGRPGIPKIDLHPPIFTVGMTEQDLVSLRNQVYRTIEQTLPVDEN